jgi:putative PIN family toxin of toxin-antitoxin system
VRVKVVVDTNVIVSGLRQPLGNPGHVLILVRTGAIVPVYDARILAEYTEVCARPRLSLVAAVVERLLSEVVRLGVRVADAPPAAFTLPDPKDQMFLDVALAGHADAIVTGNRKDFPDAGGARILSPAEMVQILAAG